MKRMYLSRDKKLAGVCGGIAEYFDLDASVVRLAWVLMTILTGIIPGVVAYIIAAAVIPPPPLTSDAPTPRNGE